MRRPFTAGAAAALIAAAGAAFVLADTKRSFDRLFPVAAAAETSVATIYYRDPDGRPAYSLTPKKTADGRAYRPVQANEDVRFEDDSMRETPVVANTVGGAGERRIKYYRNPMGLPDTSPTPKKDSMGMDYIPVYDGDDADDDAIKLSPGKIQRTGVKSEPASLRSIKALIRVPGTIQLDERRVSVISMRSEAWVQKVADVTTGTRVRKGQRLMDVYSPAISSAAADFVAAISSRTISAETSYSRGARQRIMNLDVPEPVIAEMEQSRNAPLVVGWLAPRDGVILERNAIEGMRAQPGDILFRVADISVVWATLDIAERDLGTVAVGQPVTIRARGLAGRSFTGRIDVIYPQVNRDTRTARARIQLDNADLALMPDMYVDASIDTGTPDQVVSVPESAVLDAGGHPTVFVDKGEGRFEPRNVKVGRRGAGYVEIPEGVADGENVVVAANFLIDAESNLKAALKSFSKMGASQ